MRKLSLKLRPREATATKVVTIIIKEEAVVDTAPNVANTATVMKATTMKVEAVAETEFRSL
jgi:hypothetical protein